MEKEFFVGLDIGTDSVGYAVADTEYNLLKYKGEPMWGATVFEAAQTKADRRGFRSARRRLDRRQQRVKLTQEIFANEIAKVDDKFFIRLQESGLLRDDTSINSTYFLFQDKDFTDKDYNKKYPTIHHLIQDLMTDKSPKDVRLVYIAVAWFMAHRGHFLNEVDKKNISQVTDFLRVYTRFEEYCTNHFDGMLWECDKEELKKVLQLKLSVTRKEKELLEVLNNGEKYKDAPTDVISRACVVKLLAGGTVDPAKLFLNEAHTEIDGKIKLGMPEEEFARIVAELDEDGEFLLKLRELYDWALLADILAGCNTISDAKVKIYKQHEEDLAYLKAFTKKYIKDKYYLIFRDKDQTNYAAYSGKETNKKCNKEIFCDFLKKQLKNISVLEEDQDLYDEMMERIESYTFLPKQVDGDNRVIPYQLYWHELNVILQNAKEYLPFLNEVSEGYSNLEKILSILEFRVPYYVGPLNESSPHGWMKRKVGAVGKIYPWNFEQMVDLDASEFEFINRMTNTCSYLPGEDVLPKSSLLYSKFMVLNEINNIKVNGIEIPVEVKWMIFDKFKEYRKVSIKKIEEVLCSNGCFHKEKGDVLSGIDVTVKSSLSSYHSFKRLLDSGVLSEDEVEDIITYMTYSEDKKRLKNWLEKKYAKLSIDDQKYVLHLKFKDFGRLSKAFLTEISGVNKQTGEITNILDAMWNTNDNLMQILSDKYTFAEAIDIERKAYYGGNGYCDIESMLNEMYISNSVKRPIYRTLSILDDIRKATKTTPKRIFIEMARGGGEKGKRTKSRRDQIHELYASYSRNEVRELSKLLDDMSDNELQSEVLFLYFMQMGKCMYSGEIINIEELKSSKYNVDHIYPQRQVKDDSISNKVLVLSTLNGEKGDRYPIPSEWQQRMLPTWKALHDKKMMSDEKYKRLTRSAPFSEEELQGFINRQLVETRQSTKAVANILKRIYPETEIVYVKAGLVSDFRHEYDLLKSRAVNDLHHGKDAYLNIVCGNVYHCRFTKNFSTNSDYSLKIKTLFSQTTRENGQPVWHGSEDIARIKKIMSKNNLHYTRFAFERKGGLFDQMPVKKGNGALSRKVDLPIDKYGGYNKATASFFLMVKYREKKKIDIMIMPVDLYAADKALSSEANAMEYAQKNIARILNKDISEIEILGLPLGLRKLKINTVFELDGFRVALAGKSTGGQKILISSLEPLKVSLDFERYIKRLDSFSEKRKEKHIDEVNEKYDKISKIENLQLYNLFLEKLSASKFGLIFGTNVQYLLDSRNKFQEIPVEEQVTILLNILSIFKTGRTVGCDLQAIGGSKSSAIFTLSSKMSNWKKYYKNVRIVDVSASGIYEMVSENILELL